MAKSGSGGGGKPGGSNKFGSDPVARPDSITTNEDTSITVDVLGNDSDPDRGDILRVAAVDTTGTLGDVTLNANGTVTYDPGDEFADLFNGQTATDSFTYELRDLADNKVTATVAVTITGEGEPQIANGFDGAAVLMETTFDSNITQQQVLTVGDGMEFPGHTTQLYYPYIDIDIEEDAIHLTWGNPENDWSSGSGLSVRLSDYNGSIPAIENVTVDSNVTGIDSSDVSWDEDNIWIDVGDVMVLSGDGAKSIYR